VNAGEILLRAARDFGDRPAFHSGLTFAALAERAQRFAGGLLARGIGDGDVVPLRMANSPRFAVAYYGILLAGGVVAPNQLDGVNEGNFAEFDGAPRRGEPGDVAQILRTGGTTGLAKQVEVTHSALLANVEAWAQAVPPDDTVRITVAPWFHAFGSVYGLNLAVHSGVLTILPDVADPEQILADVQRHGATSITGAPPLFAMLAAIAHERDLSSLRYLVTGGAPMSAELEQRVREVFPHAALVDTYGMTEALGVARDGLPLPGVEVRLAEGEICVRSPSVMRGYASGSDETVVRDGWLHTGDIGEFRDGRLRIVDRKKDVLFYLGMNVYPRVLEDLLSVQPGVALAAVVGRPDPEVGEMPVAFVVAGPGADLTEEGLLDAVNPRVAPHQRLSAIRFVDHIPRSPSGKVLKRELTWT
jgi:long-chain acyl-CoA synthetase